MLLTCLTGCKTTNTSQGGLFAPPVRPELHWHDDGDRVSLSKSEAVALARYFIDVDAYIKKTQ
jgi:hypothetical protein